MKQFSLEEFKKNPNRKVVTRYGRPVRIICTDAKGSYPVIGLVLSKDVEDPNGYTENGVYLNNSESSSDLFFEPEKKEGWVNLYRQSEDCVITGDLVLKTKEEAIKCISTKDYIATIHIEWEE